VQPSNALEEFFFLGLRLNRGVDLREAAASFSQQVIDDLSPTIAELVGDGVLRRDGNCISLTSRGQLLSNEVFQRFLATSLQATYDTRHG